MATDEEPAAPFFVTVIDTVVSLIEKRLLAWRPAVGDTRL